LLFGSRSDGLGSVELNAEVHATGADRDRDEKAEQGNAEAYVLVEATHKEDVEPPFEDGEAQRENRNDTEKFDNVHLFGPLLL
jgi:hypothetical protein